MPKRMNLIYQTGISDDCCLSNNNTHPVINKDTFPYFGSGVNINAGKKATDVRNQPG